jgi:hypothetical protein
MHHALNRAIFYIWSSVVFYEVKSVLCVVKYIALHETHDYIHVLQGVLTCIMKHFVLYALKRVVLHEVKCTSIYVLKSVVLHAIYKVVLHEVACVFIYVAKCWISFSENELFSMG